MTEIEFGDFVGNAAVREYLSTVFVKGNLAHAYCFVGPVGVGKRRVAETIARALLESGALRSVGAASVGERPLTLHPDFRLVVRGYNEKTKKRQRDITIDAIRELNGWLSQTAATGVKVAIIDEAEALNAEAANALLKTLEEPRGRTHIFLILTDESRLPETLLSRTSRINFSIATDEELKTMAGTSAEVRKLITLAAGCPGRLIHLLQDSEYRAWALAESERFEKILSVPLFARVKLVDDFWAKSKGDPADADHIESRDRLGEILNIWALRLRTMLRAGENQARVSRLLRKVLETRRGLIENLYPKLIIDQLLISFSYEY